MNPRIVLALAVLLALGIAFAAWSVGHTRPVGPPRIVLDASRAEFPRGSVETMEQSPAAEPPAAARVPVSRVDDSPASTAGAQPTRIASTGAFVGTITSSADGRPVPKADVSCIYRDSGEHATIILEGHTDERGRFRIEGVKTGDWGISCTAAGYRDAERSVWMPSSVGDVNADFVLTPVAPEMDIVVHLRSPDGRPFFATLGGNDARIASLLRPVFCATCPARGADLTSHAGVILARAARLPSGNSDAWYRATLESDKSGCCCVLLGDFVIDAQPFSSGTTDVVLTVSADDLQRATGGLHVEVVDDASGQPIANARVTVKPAYGLPSSADTDAQGAASFERLMAGGVGVDAVADGHAHAKADVVIFAGRDAATLNLRLPASVTVTGWMDLPSSGSSGSGFVLVSLFRVVGGVVQSNPERVAFAGKTFYEQGETNVRLGPHGEFEFTNLQPGTYLVGWGASAPDKLGSLAARGAVHGWNQVDASLGDVRGVHVVVTDAMWKSNTEDF